MGTKTQWNSAIFVLILIFHSPPLLAAIAAKSNSSDADQYPQPTGLTSTEMFIVVLLMLMGFFFFVGISFCVHCTNTNMNGLNDRPLEIRIGAVQLGIDPSTVDAFPTCLYSEVKEHKIGEDELECAICLTEYQGEEILCLLPACDHVFHHDCIKMWLECHVTCPVCRANLSPQADGKADGVIINPDDNVVGNNGGGDNHEVVVQVFDDSDYQRRQQQQRRPRSATAAARNMSGTWRVCSGKRLRFGSFKSHSTGHSMAQYGECLNRFTLKLPAQVRKEMTNRAILRRTRTCLVDLSRDGSVKKWYGVGGGEGSNQATTS